MNEIIATIILVLPYTTLVVAFIGAVILYALALNWSLDNEHKILTLFLLSFAAFMCSMGLAYFFGHAI